MRPCFLIFTNKNRGIIHHGQCFEAVFQTRAHHCSRLVGCDHVRPAYRGGDDGRLDHGEEQRDGQRQHLGRHADAHHLGGRRRRRRNRQQRRGTAPAGLRVHGRVDRQGHGTRGHEALEPRQHGLYRQGGGKCHRRLLRSHHRWPAPARRDVQDLASQRDGRGAPHGYLHHHRRLDRRARRVSRHHGHGGVPGREDLQLA